MDAVRRLLFFLLLLAFNPFVGSSETLLPAPSGELSPFQENGKVGLKNTKGEVLIPASYEAIGWSDGSFSVVQNVTGFKLKGEWGLINVNNHKLTKAEYAEMMPGSSSFITARKKFPNSFRLLTGCLNTAGKVVLPFEYDGIKISGLRAIVIQKNGRDLRYGLYDLNNNVVIPLTYRNIYALGSLRYGVVNQNDKTAIFGEDGVQLTGFVIDSILSFRKNYAVIFQANKQGVISRDGKIVVEPVYRELIVGDNGSYSRRKSDAWIFLSGDNKSIREVEADSINAAFRERYEVKSSTNSNLVDLNFKTLTARPFSDIKPFSSRKAFARLGNKIGVISSDGSDIIPALYTTLLADNNFYRATQPAGNHVVWLLLDSTGRRLTSKSYEHIGSFNGKFFPVKHRNYWGGIDSKGQEIIACAHDSIIGNVDEYVVVKFKGGYGIIDTKERWIITPQRNPLKLMDKGRYLETTRDNRLIKNMRGEIIYFTANPIEIKTDCILEFLPNGTIWKIDEKGIVTNHDTAPTQIEKIFPESEGYRAIKKDGRFGFVDSRLRLRIANRYEDVKPFKEGLAAAKILGKWGFINKEDNIAVQPVYDEVFAFSNGVAVVKKNGMFGLIDKKGKIILPVRYESLIPTHEKRILIQQNGLHGLADYNGKIILNTKYTTLRDMNNGYVIVEQDHKFGVVNLDGVSTIPMIYDWIETDKFSDRFLALKKATWEEGAL